MDGFNEECNLTVLDSVHKGPYKADAQRAAQIHAHLLFTILCVSKQAQKQWTAAKRQKWWTRIV